MSGDNEYIKGLERAIFEAQPDIIGEHEAVTIAKPSQTTTASMGFWLCLTQWLQTQPKERE